MMLFFQRHAVTISAVIAILSIAFFLVRVIRYTDRPTYGYTTYFAAGKFVAAGMPGKLLYDNTAFFGARAHLVGVESREPFGPNTPFLPILFVPFSFLPLPVSKMLWETASLILLIAFIRMMSVTTQLGRAESFALTGLVFAVGPVYTTFVYGQMYILILVIIAAAIRCWLSNRVVLASLFLALAILLKGFGLFLLVAAALAKDWAIVAATSGFVIAGVLLSSTVVGPQAWASFFMTLPSFVDPPDEVVQRNLQGLLSFLSGTDPHLLLSVLAPTAVVVLAVLHRKSRRDRAFVLQAAVILSVLLSPLTADYHSVLLLLPAIFLFARLQNKQGGTSLFLFTIFLVLLAANAPPTSPWMSGGFISFVRVFAAMASLTVVLMLGMRRPSTEIDSLLRTAS